MLEIDARGLSCPEPVILTKKGIADGPKELKVIVDNNVSMENVSRYLKSSGYAVETKEEAQDLIVYGKK